MLQRENSESTTVSDANVPLMSTGAKRTDSKESPNSRTPKTPKSRKNSSEGTRKRRLDARVKREEAERALREKLQEVKRDAEFKQEAESQANLATHKFASHYAGEEEAYSRRRNSKDKAATVAGGPAGGSTNSKGPPANEGGSPMIACKRMLTSLSKTLRKPEVNDKNGKKPQPEAEDRQWVAEERIDVLLAGLRVRIGSAIDETFNKLASSSRRGPGGQPSITPMVFQKFLCDMDSSIKRHQAGMIWRRGDLNVDGFMDYTEFRNLFGDQLNVV